MPFPTGSISAADIRNELAATNTAGAQNNVGLNDTAVRAAANQLSGSVSYSSLRGVRVLFSGLITFGSLQPDPDTVYFGYRGDAHIPMGSVNTTSYYRLPYDYNTGSYRPKFVLFYSNGPAVTSIGDSDYLSRYTTQDVSTLYVTIGSSRYTFNSTRGASSSFWYQDVSGDFLGLMNRVGGTYQVVITY